MTPASQGLGASSSRGVSMFQVKVSMDELRLDGTLKVMGLINNSKCQEPVAKLELSLTRVLKYRTDVHSNERVQRKRLLTKTLKGVPRQFRDPSFVRNLDACLAEVFPLADGLESNFVELGGFDQMMPFLQLMPTCVSQNFICYYQIEVSIHHGNPVESDFTPTKLEFELFLDVAAKVLSLVSNGSESN